MTNALLTLFPVLAAIIGATIAARMSPGPKVVSGLRHFAAGVVFAAAASEILPDVMHGASPIATIVGGLLGLAIVLGVKQAEETLKGASGLLVAVGIDVLIDGIVLGVAFAAGQKAGVLLAIALTVEILSLGLVLTGSLMETMRSPVRAVLAVGGISLLLPIGALAGGPAALLPSPLFTGFLSLGLVALLYLVTEELLVEAHETKDTPLITSMFFIGFLALLVLEEFTG